MAAQRTDVIVWTRSEFLTKETGGEGLLLLAGRLSLPCGPPPSDAFATPGAELGAGRLGEGVLQTTWLSSAGLGFRGRSASQQIPLEGHLLSI